MLNISVLCSAAHCHVLQYLAVCTARVPTRATASRMPTTARTDLSFTHWPHTASCVTPLVLHDPCLGSLGWSPLIKGDTSWFSKATFWWLVRNHEKWNRGSRAFALSLHVSDIMNKRDVWAMYYAIIPHHWWLDHSWLGRVLSQHGIPNSDKSNARKRKVCDVRCNWRFLC